MEIIGDYTYQKRKREITVNNINCEVKLSVKIARQHQLQRRSQRLSNSNIW
jgi:hypothetical protein